MFWIGLVLFLAAVLATIFATLGIFAFACVLLAGEAERRFEAMGLDLS
jgi:hypothetical protein